MTQIAPTTQEQLKHRKKVADLKANLPVNWTAILQERLGKSRTFVSLLVNRYEDFRPEWVEVKKLKAEHLSIVQ